jgi:hypothetical protein
MFTSAVALNCIHTLLPWSNGNDSDISTSALQMSYMRLVCACMLLACRQSLSVTVELLNFCNVQLLCQNYCHVCARHTAHVIQLPYALQSDIVASFCSLSSPTLLLLPSPAGIELAAAVAVAAAAVTTAAAFAAAATTAAVAAAPLTIPMLSTLLIPMLGTPFANSCQLFIAACHYLLLHCQNCCYLWPHMAQMCTEVQQSSACYFRTSFEHNTATRCELAGERLITQ